MLNNIGIMYLQWRQKYGSKCPSMDTGVPASGPPEKSNKSHQITKVLAVQDNVLDRNSSKVPSALIQTLKAELSKVNIQPNILEVPQSFQSIRHTDQRLNNLEPPFYSSKPRPSFSHSLRDDSAGPFLAS